MVFYVKVKVALHKLSFFLDPFFAPYFFSFTQYSILKPTLQAAGLADICVAAMVTVSGRGILVINCQAEMHSASVLPDH